jgi:predicted O-methyltransferase YrrM
MVSRRRAPVKRVEKLLGCDLNEFCDRLYAQKPEWVEGTLSHYDTRFLFRKALLAGTAVAVEIGTASGFSTTVLCNALNALSKAGVIGSEFSVVSYDIAAHFYANREKNVGDVARELLPPELLDHISFRNPAMAVNLRDSFGRDEVGFLFLDANHRHPWPTLDLLATLDILAPGAFAVFHDINLPARSSEDPGLGVKHLFENVDAENDVPQDEGVVPNIGSLIIPSNKERFRDQLLGILFDHEWEVNVGEDITSLALA